MNNIEILVPSQFTYSSVSNICTGLTYIVAENLNKIIDLLKNNNVDKYIELFKELILKSAERKLNNKNINEYGEFIDEDTIKKDFETIYNNYKFLEFFQHYTNEEFENNNFKNDISKNITDILNNCNINDLIIICRNRETYSILKISNSVYFVIDSHQNIHKSLELDLVVDNIIMSRLYTGFINLGIPIKYLDNI